MVIRTVSTCLLLFAVTHVAAADDQANAREILDKAIKVHGGEAALRKYVGMTFKAKCNIVAGDMKIPTTFEGALSGDYKLRMVTLDERGRTESIDVVNGKQGWTKAGDEETKELTTEQLETQREAIFMDWSSLLVSLKAKDVRLAVGEEITVADKKAVCIVASRDKHPDLKVYFSKDTHLFVKTQRKYKNEEGKEVDEVCIYSDYHDLADIMQPMKSVTFEDGTKIMETELTELKFSEKPLDDKLFAKP